MNKHDRAVSTLRIRANILNRQLAPLDAEMWRRSMAGEFDGPRLSYDTPWSTLDLMPYRHHHLADEPLEVVCAILGTFKKWGDEELDLLSSHCGPDTVCVKCVSAILAALSEGAVDSDLLCKYAYSLYEDGGTFIKDDLCWRYFVRDGRVQFTAQPTKKLAGKRGYYVRFITDDMQYATEEEVRVELPGRAEAQLRLDCNVGQLSYVQIFEM